MKNPIPVDGNLQMPEARFIADDGSVEIVQPPASILRPGNVAYDKVRHKGHLSCLFCAVAVRMHSGRVGMIAGTNVSGAQRPHFQHYPKQEHEQDCAWPIEMERRKRELDESNGLKIHLNTDGYLQEFNRNAGRVYTKDENHKIVSDRPELNKRKAVPVHNAADILTFERATNPELLEKSVLVHYDKVENWGEFVVRYDGDTDNAGYRRLLKQLHEGQRPVALMEVQFERGTRHGSCETGTTLSSRQIFIGEDKRWRKHFIQPDLHLKNLRNPSMRDLVPQGGSYMVLDYPKLKTLWQDDVVIHTIHINVRDPRQIAAAKPTLAL